MSHQETLREKWMWNREMSQCWGNGFITIGIVMAIGLYPFIGLYSLFFLALCFLGFLWGFTYGIVDRKVKAQWDSLAAQGGERAESLIVNGAVESPGVAVLKEKELVLSPIVGNRLTLLLSEMTFVREVVFLNGRKLVGKRRFVIETADSRRIGFAVPESVGSRWVSKLVLRKEPSVSIDTSQPIYESGARWWNKKKVYRIYADRIELDCRMLVRKTFVIRSLEIIDIWTSQPTTLRDIPRIGGLWHAWSGLKLDLADLFKHVGLHCSRTGHFKSFFFVPDDPDAFVDVVNKKLLLK